MLQKLEAEGGACEDEARRADNRVGQCRASHVSTRDINHTLINLTKLMILLVR